MCGIAALFGQLPEREARARIEKMTHVVSHRGPDGMGAIVLSGAALGHRRLSIIDLSDDAIQPMTTPDQTVWITFNGEIYNYLELREELEKEGVQFRTKSDTEVLLQAYLHWGKSCLSRLNGMFAFVIYDKGKIFAARDRFGVKPLYYWKDQEGTLYFASEIKQFTTLPTWRARLHHQRAHDFLQWGISEHESETLFLGVKQLRGGEYYDTSPKRWYTLPTNTFQGDEEEAKELLKSHLEASIRLRLRADVPVGSCLSGGIDSSSLVTLAHHLGHSLHTFSVRSEVKAFDEGEYLQAVLAKTACKNSSTIPSVDAFFEQLDKLIWHQEMPFGGTSIFAQWELFRLIQESGIKVVLDGQGADEIFGGYNLFFGLRLAELVRTGSWGAFLKELKSTRTLNPILHLVKELLPEPLQQFLLRKMGKPSLKNSWLTLAAEDRLAMPRSKTVKEEMLQQILCSSLPQLLHTEDRNSMAHGVESRTPFLDYSFVEYATSLPTHFSHRTGRSKWILREALADVLPEKIAKRRTKLGFATAEPHWILSRVKRFREEERRAIESANGVIKEGCYEGPRLMRVITFGRWMECFHVQV